MSVHGEYRRLLAELVAFLNSTESAACAASAAELEACSAAAVDEGLSDAARRTLAVCAALDTDAFSQAQRDEYSARSQHLAAICEALLP